MRLVSGMPFVAALRRRLRIAFHPATAGHPAWFEIMDGNRQLATLGAAVSPDPTAPPELTVIGAVPYPNDPSRAIILDRRRCPVPADSRPATVVNSDP